MTNISLHVTRILHGRPRHLSAQSAKSDILMLSAVGFLRTNFGDKHPQQLTKQASITLEKATEVYMVEVIAESHCQKHRLISFTFPICLLL